MATLNALPWFPATKWWSGHENLCVGTRLPTELQVSWQLSACPPCLLTWFFFFFEHLLCTMHCSRFCGYSCDQGRQRETMKHASSGPVTTVLPIFPAHLSIPAVPRMCQLLTGLWEIWERNIFVTHLYLSSTEPGLKLASCLSKAIEWKLFCVVWHPTKANNPGITAPVSRSALQKWAL